MLNFIRVNKSIFKRILFTLFILILFRMGALITMPAVEWQGEGTQTNQLLTLLSTLGGGIINRLSIFALGISPFITASIVVQLLGSGLIPAIGRWTKQGRYGQVKLNYLTKFLTVPIAYLQAFAIIKSLENSNLIVVNWSTVGYHQQLFYYFLCPLILIAGTMITLLLADLISLKGIGQGISVIIFTGILASVAYQFDTAGKNLFQQVDNLNQTFFDFNRFFIYLLSIFFLLYLIIFLNNSERRIPVQQTGMGLRLTNQRKTYLPIKLNPSGVIPVIFASTLFSLFGSVSEIVKNAQPDSGYVAFVEKYLAFSSWVGIGIFAGFVFLFALMYTHVVINSENLAENFKKNGVYIPGVNPGEETSRYITYVVNRLVFFGGLYLTFLSVFSLFVAKLLFPDQVASFAISGTSLLILVLVGENILFQIVNLKKQVNYMHLWNKKSDIFLW